MNCLHILIILVSILHESQQKRNDKELKSGGNTPQQLPENKPVFIINGNIGNNRKKAVNLQFLPTIREDQTPLIKPRSSRLLVRSKQLWRGVEVYGHGATFLQGQETSINQAVSHKFKQDIDKDVASNIPSITKAEAFQTAVLDRKMVATDIDIYPKDVNNSRFKLLIFVDRRDKKSKLIYRFDFLIARKNRVTGMKTLSNAFVKIDAQDGTVIESYEELTSLLANGEGGNIKVGKYKYGEGAWAGRQFEVTEAKKGKCKSSNPLTLVSNAQGAPPFLFPPSICFLKDVITPYSEPCKPTSPNKDATEFSYSQVHDALYFATNFQEMLKNQFGDDRIQQCCGQVRLCVHSNGTQGPYFYYDDHCDAYFGTAGGSLLDHVCPSMVAHELCHALIHCTSELESYRQSGAIAESFCDLCGIVYKASLNNFQTDWKIANEIVIAHGTITALRYINDPPLDGLSIQHTQDYTDQLDIHYTSGIYSKAIYNLASRRNWDLQKVFHLFLRANKFYWTSVTTFNQGLCDLIEAADDFLYEISDVVDAFANVGVFCACPAGWLTHTVNEISSCLKPLNDKASWAEANIYCKSIKGKLVSIRDKVKSDFINSMLNDTTKVFWLGASDIRSEGQWMWTNKKSTIVYTNWLPEKPSTDLLKNCMVMAYDIVSQRWGWSNEVCSTKNSFLCELA